MNAIIEPPKVRHPARYSKELLPVLCAALEGYERILDPMAGTGERLLSIRPDAWLNELEPEWAAISRAFTPNSYVGSARNLPWPDNYFDAICTSPTYGNRMADHHNAKDASRRNTYRHALGRRLDHDNTGAIQWSRKYRQMHLDIWREVWRVLRPGGRFVLNVKDHIRKGQVVPVARFHRLLCLVIGFRLVEVHQIETPGQRHGANGNLRVNYEYVFVFEKP